MPTFAWTFVPHLLRVFGLLLLLLASRDASAQQPELVAGQSLRGPLLPAHELQTYFFTPRFAAPRELQRLADELYGRHIWLLERGGYDHEPVRNLQSIGDTLIIYDTPEQAQRIGEALHGLDEQAKVSAEAEATASNLVVAEWAPGFISLQTALSALENFRRPVASSTLHHQQAVTVNVTDVWNVSMVQERAVLVLRDTPEQVEQMVALLERLDLPEPQLLLSCLVLRGSDHSPEPDAAPPAELSEHLALLVPYEHFAVVSRGIVRSSALAKSIELRIDDQFRLELAPEAYDAGTRSLTAQCQFVATSGLGFVTRATVTAGEYAVLGATGREPVFVVLQLQSLP